MRPASNSRRRARPLLGTFVEIAVAGAPATEADTAIDAAFGVIADVHRLMSFHEPTSDVARINREASARPVAVHPWTFRVLEMALDLHHRSAGAFDIAVAPALQSLGMLPGDAARREWMPAGGCAIELLPGGQVRFHRRDVAIDLGGIAKGFAVDRARDALVACGMPQGLINAGGDVAAFGTADRVIDIRDPRNPRRILCEVALRDEALASSGGLVDPIRHGTAIHTAVIDPRTGRPVTASCGASLCAPSCAIADALTKVVMIAGENAVPLLREERACALLVSQDGGIRVTGEWQEKMRHAA